MTDATAGSLLVRRSEPPRPASPGGAADGRSAADATLDQILERARRLGFIGPAAIADQIEHSRRFGAALHDDWGVETPLVCDLGAGGGLPSLPMALAHPRLHLVLVDASRRRTSFLVWGVVELALGGRVEVWLGRAEDFGHDPARRHTFDAVVARGFAAPAATLECAAPLLAVGGRCVISEPPGGRSWPPDSLAELGLVQRPTQGGFARFDRVGDVPAAYPRSPRVQQRDPLFEL